MSTIEQICEAVFLPRNTFGEIYNKRTAENVATWPDAKLERYVRRMKRVTDMHIEALLIGGDGARYPYTIFVPKGAPEDSVLEER